MASHWKKGQPSDPSVWAQVALQTLKDFFNKCLNPQCEAGVGLEFAHLRETDIDGRGRGKKERLTDIRKHPDRYSRLCNDCHDTFDHGGFGKWRPMSLLQVANACQVALFPVQRKRVRKSGPVLVKVRGGGVATVSLPRRGSRRSRGEGAPMAQTTNNGKVVRS